MKLSSKTKICLVIGDPIEHSLSPQMHNSAYKSLGLDSNFVYLAAQVKVAKIKKVVEAMQALNIRGISCTIPHKVEILKYLKNIDPIAKKIGAVNTLVNTGNKIIGYNTDWLGVLTPLKVVKNIKGKKVALLGAGGAARAAAYGITHEGGKLTIYNRNVDKAETLAKEFKCEARGLSELKQVKDAEIVINSTPLGMMPNLEESPLPKEFIQKNQIIFDIVYNPLETKLIKDAKSKGARVILGLEMLLYQGVVQFELYTGQKAPVAVMRKTLLQCLKERNEK